MTLKRLPTIKSSLRKGLNREQIGEKCGVTEKTIDRDMSAWVDSGLFHIWIREEFLDLHRYVRDADPIEAYRQIAKIVGKTLVQRVEKKLDVTERKEEYVSITATINQHKTLSEALAILERKTKPHSIH